MNRTFGDTGVPGAAVTKDEGGLVDAAAAAVVVMMTVGVRGHAPLSSGAGLAAARAARVRPPTKVRKREFAINDCMVQKI